jgi:hypothetical protein
VRKVPAGERRGGGVLSGGICTWLGARNGDVLDSLVGKQLFEDRIGVTT